jgi:hypothetical protein
MAESAGSIMNGNGHTNGMANGKPLAGRRRAVKKRRSFLAWTFNVVARYVLFARHRCQFARALFWPLFHQRQFIFAL